MYSTQQNLATYVYMGNVVLLKTDQRWLIRVYVLITTEQNIAYTLDID